MMTKNSAVAILGLTTATVVLLTLTLQYPFSVSFPIGGDAPAYIETAQLLLNGAKQPAEAAKSLRSTWYPLAHGIVAASIVAPLDWPARFTWLMATGYILAGVAIGALLYRFQGWPTAAIGMVIWSLTTTGVTRHIEDGTLAQLWSFVFLALYLERVTARSTWLSILALLATTATHPVTGATLLATNMLVLPMMLVSLPLLPKEQRRQFCSIATASVVLLLVIAISKSLSSTSASVVGASSEPFINIVVSSFAPIVALAPIGLIVLLTSKHTQLSKITLATLYSASLLLAANQLFGINVWTERLLPTFVFSTTIAASLALHHITNLVFSPRKLLPTALLVIFFSIMIISTWQSNARIYAHYENPANYSRLHPKELEAIIWMGDNLPPNSTIITAETNRHSEWIPVLTTHKWEPTSEHSEVVTTRLETVDAQKANNYMVFFTIAEKVRGKYATWPDDYPPVFQNDVITILPAYAQ